MSKLWQAAKDWWEVAVALGGALMGAINVAYQLSTEGSFQPNFIIGIGILLFFVFGSWAIIKANRKARVLQSAKRPANNYGVTTQADIIIPGNNISSPIINAEVSGKVAGRDIVETHFHYNQKKNSEDQLRRVNLGIEPQSKIIGGEPYIIVVITNGESERIYCRVEIRGIYDETENNILRDISQFANHFSWSGGRASEDGMRVMEAGLDGTVNIAVIHHMAFNLFWLFHEDPNKNWADSGVYKLKLTIQGKIEGNDFVGQDLEIRFRYTERKESNEFGEFFNKGQLELLGWEVINHKWLMI